MTTLGICDYFCGGAPATRIDYLGNPCCLACDEPPACGYCGGRGEMRSAPHGTTDWACRPCQGTGYANPAAASTWEAALAAEEATHP